MGQLGWSNGNAVIRDYDRDLKTARARLAVLSTLSAASSVPSVAGRRIALVIGNGAYTDNHALRNPPNDARALGSSLRGMGFEVSEGINLGHDAMARMISEFLHDAAAARVALIFYAGHGIQVGGKNYLVPVDVRFDQPFEPSASMTDVDTILAALDDRIRANIVILDACRDNPILPQAAALTGASRSVSAPGLARTADPGAGATAGAGTLIAFATAPGQVALDGDGVHSPFSAALLRHISTPGLGSAADDDTCAYGGRRRDQEQASAVVEFLTAGRDLLGAVKLRSARKADTNRRTASVCREQA
jgi:Caspase domain